MKLRILVGAALWTALITLLHIWANVGFAELGVHIRTWLGIVRPALQVAFLPVT